MTRILLTGATGLIGGAVLHQALDQHDEAKWVCLVRCASVEQGRQRIVARLERFTDPFTAQRLARKVEVVPGDFTRADVDMDPRLDACTQVLHLAADTAWWGGERVFQTNHDGTLALARRARAMPNLRRVLHVGTAMSCGADAPTLVAEAPPDPGARHLVPYTASKAATEASLAERCADLPIVVARPSIVVGHSTLGAAPSSSILWLVRAINRLRLLPSSPQSRCDIIPADWTARALLHLLLKPELAHGLYHVSGGAGSCSRWSDLDRAFAALEPRDGAVESFDLADRAVLRARFAAAFGLDSALKLTMLRAVRAYYAFCALDIAFANERLLAEGVPPPPPLSAYLATCLANSAPIVDQFADDLEMFTRPPAPARGARAALPLAASA